MVSNFINHLYNETYIKIPTWLGSEGPDTELWEIPWLLPITGLYLRTEPRSFLLLNLQIDLAILLHTLPPKVLARCVCGLVEVGWEGWENDGMGIPPGTHQGPTRVHVSSFLFSVVQYWFLMCRYSHRGYLFFSSIMTVCLPLIFSPLWLSSPDYRILCSLLWVGIGKKKCLWMSLTTHILSNLLIYGINYDLTSSGLRMSMPSSQDQQEHTCSWTNLAYYVMQWGRTHTTKNQGVVCKRVLERTYRICAWVKRFWKGLRKWGFALDWMLSASRVILWFGYLNFI